MSIGNPHYYLEKASACKKMAASARTEEERECCLKLAASWLCLMPGGSRGEELAFMAKHAATGTGRADSTATY